MPVPAKEPMPAMYAQSVTCPFCDHRFKTMKVRSRRATPQIIDSDFCPHYQVGGLNPNHYHISVCPECGFAFSQDFTDDFPPQAKEEIRKQISAKWERRDFGQIRDLKQVIESYKLAIYSAALKGEKHAIQGEICQRLAWVYREEENEEEGRFLRLALAQLEDSYKHSDFVGTPLSEMKVLYLAGELHRRLGQYPQAIAYFAKIAEHPNRSHERGILNLARQQWRATAEANRVQ
ncbi:hypothetical protein CEB3_c06400 [Peptococcaceae bacterium CEB3]|nr:hypothetical protein CEB3_c06400 [Peptococcaceae bacterium CEB3]